MKFIGKYSAQVKFTAQLMMIVTATAFVCLGVYRGEVETVFAKAIRLCLECVGIG
ncbi:thioredoxin [Clostridium cochlearium]|uniref:Thioredoxin n=1 Tax=Clostridium cochlearium TaxID=1494 RepID=A0A7Y3XZ49_CLOCO|nr:CD1871A family CXXC motif-containing protein [Clostridium cochlearium]NOH16489.1 thioredoxin [Clostridium cochlearium]